MRYALHTRGYISQGSLLDLFNKKQFSKKFQILNEKNEKLKVKSPLILVRNKVEAKSKSFIGKVNSLNRKL